MRALWIIPLALTGCVTAAERDSISKAWGDCIAEAVQRLDDRKSDPVSMAYAIAPQCAVLYNQLTEAMVHEHITDNGQRYMRAEMKANETKMVASAVVVFRSKVR